MRFPCQKTTKIDSKNETNSLPGKHKHQSSNAFLISLLALGLGFFSTTLSAVNSQGQVGLPAAPSDENHPGSSTRLGNFQKESFTVDSRKVDVYFPVGLSAPAPVVAFGHGQAIGVEGYDKTFEQMARKGVAVIHPMYDRSFFDRDWPRMAQDFVNLTRSALQRYPQQMNADQVVFAGHSKGAYVAGMAAGIPGQSSLAKAIVLFAPAGLDSRYVATLPNLAPLTLIHSDADTVVEESIAREIFQKAPSQKKQFIKVRSYKGTQPELAADHFFPLTKGYFFGGKDGVTPLHYFGSWKWLIGAGWDLSSGNKATNTYLYGAESLTSGIPTLQHSVERVGF